MWILCLPRRYSPNAAVRRERLERIDLYEYLLVNILIVLFPVLLSFDKNVHFYKKVKAYLPTLLTAGLFFIVWDAIATARGHWHFNEDYITGIRLLGLPIEEILFFITVPYACIFTYECLLFYVKEREVPYSKWPYLSVAVALGVVAFIFINQEYTFIDLVVAAATIILAVRFFPSLFRSNIYWYFLAITLGLFVFANYFLTSIPIVGYGPAAIWGTNAAWDGRVITIPYEDFFYNFSLLTLYLMVFLSFKKRWELD